MITLDKLKPGDIVPGDYRLTTKLSKHKYFMATWRATSTGGDDVALNLYSTTTYDSDPGYDPHDLHEAFEVLLPTLELLRTLPPTPGLAPLLNYIYDPDVLILVRKFYHDRLNDRYPAGKISADTVLENARQLATTFDALRRMVPEMSFFITPEHLMLEDDQVIVLDYGLEHLLKTIEYSYTGSRPVTARWNYEMGWYPSHLFKEGSIPPEYALALLYYYLRTGFGVFEHHDPALHAFSRINWDGITRYGEQGTLPDVLQNADSGEWSVIKAALARPTTFSSCAELVSALELALHSES
ncbi:MAG: hypothetical protein OHK0046_20770 [Anaerolineae bacterium]